LNSGAQAVSPLLHEPKAIGPTLDLIECSLTPNPVTSGATARFTMAIRAKDAARINELALLVFSSQEMRVGIIDLRSHGLPASLGAGDTFTIAGTIRGLPLVEGEYRIGLYAVAGDYAGNLFDLAELSVAARPAAEGHAPYPAMHRGVLEFDVAVDAAS
jgi:hypothetical protein